MGLFFKVLQKPLTARVAAKLPPPIENPWLRP